MLKWLFERRSRPGVKSLPQAPEGSRIYAIGDIHGRADLLADLHDQIRADASSAPARKIVIYLGDYIDRGLQSRGVIDALLDGPLPGFEAVHLKGNHEAALLDFLTDARIGANWMQFGGGSTLLSYRVGLTNAETGGTDYVSAQQEFAERLPARHLAFYRTLALNHREGDYLFVHAGLRPGVPLDQQTAEDMLWIRDDFLDFTGTFGPVVVHGHTITDAPEVRDNRIGIDTGAFATGQLTCLVLEGSERRFLST
jgi:serine/threonine protein phosphatase 1